MARKTRGERFSLCPFGPVFPFTVDHAAASSEAAALQTQASKKYPNSSSSGQVCFN